MFGKCRECGSVLGIIKGNLTSAKVYKYASYVTFLYVIIHFSGNNVIFLAN